MKATRTKDFPIFNKEGDTGDECPECLSVIVSIGFDKGICPTCASESKANYEAKTERDFNRAVYSALDKAGRVLQ